MKDIISKSFNFHVCVKESFFQKKCISIIVYLSDLLVTMVIFLFDKQIHITTCFFVLVDNII